MRSVFKRVLVLVVLTLATLSPPDGLRPAFGKNCSQNPGACGPDVDLDDDGIADAEDNCPFVPNPLQEDADQDGFGGNGSATLGCDPFNDDPDGDGFPNAVDNCPFVHNPLQPDFDADGLGDECDEY